MGKRILIVEPTKLKPENIGEEVNIETTERKVWHGRITKLAPDSLSFHDGRLKEHTLKFSDVSKVYLERVTAY